MKTVNQNLVAIALGLGLGLSVSTANAVTPFVYDVTRTAEFAIEGVQRMLSYVSRVQEEESKEEEQVTWEKRKDNKDAQAKASDGGSGDGSDGSSGEGGSSGGSSKKSDKPKKLPYESEFYKYMGGKTDCDLAKEEKDAGTDETKGEPDEENESDENEETERINPMAMGSEQYLPAMADAGEAEDYIRQNFFFDPDLDKVTEEEKNRIEQHRYAYVETLATEVLQISQGARSAIAKDLGVLSESKTTAGGDVNQVEFMVQTKKVMAEQKAADIVLQAKLMELEAAKMLLNLSPQRIEDPSKSE